MRRIVNSTYMTLDGLTEQLGAWHFAYQDDSATKYAADQLAGSDALLMGRRTYEAYAATWPSQTGVLADRINTMEKHVASTTLDEPAWDNTTVLRGDLVEEVTALREQPGKDILMHGVGPVARTLLNHGLLDEIHLWIHPVLVGAAGPDDLIFREGTAATMSLAGTTTLDSGVVVLAYRL